MTKIAFDLLKAGITIFIVHEMIGMLIRHFGITEMIGKFIYRVLVFLILFGVLYHALIQMGADAESIQSASALMALMIGVASKKTISNLIAGVFLEVEDLIHPYDFIIIKKYAGIVVAKNLFYITIEDGDENRKKIRCQDFVNFNNASYNPSTIYIDAKVSVKVPMKEIDEIVKSVFENSQEKFTSFIESPEFLGIEKFKDGKMVLRFMGRCKGKDRKKSIVSLTNAIRKAFTQKDMEILLPFGTVESFYNIEKT